MRQSPVLANPASPAAFRQQSRWRLSLLDQMLDWKHKKALLLLAIEI
ncbi:MAG: hypothetical protein HC786_24130 [Richelia sp. CSU_2_1]|nr:hypothetical protein [Microcoleus sp. SU_5_6]NJL66335.1 hypothetical protein [Microcoleus sp. SM1_3_4]NJR25028.1 hypothetical protein [Richelia sp. CSU_2_1]